MNINHLIEQASASTPDPDRSRKNLARLAPEWVEEHEHEIGSVAALFSYSQFLADYSIENPSRLTRAFQYLHTALRKQEILAEARNRYVTFRDEERLPTYRQNAMNLLREVKKDNLLRITLKDITGITNLNESMSELSTLAEALTELALDMSFTVIRRKFGLMRDNAFSLIGMGKLGAGELNYSSDIDIITMYRSEGSTSTGILNPFGIRHNKISAHEYFCTLTEVLTNLLQSPTEDGFAYRTDLRLRPNGQKGALSLSLDSYRSYYEAWGKTWERIALIRARPVAGDPALGEGFLHAVEPFVWKRSMDYNDIEELRALKKRIDSISDINDIKRGYGGIREIEFFVHTHQLLYGGEKKNLRQGSLITAVEQLLQEGFLSGDDTRILSESYLLLRRIEHILQMRDDMQVYALPGRSEELEILSRKMRFENLTSFSVDLRLKRLKVRDMYNSLLGAPDETQEAVLSLREELPESAIMDYLSFKGFKKPDSALKILDALIEQISTGKTLQERILLRKTVPAFLELAVKSVNKDRSLVMLASFIGKIGHHQAYIDLLLQRPDTREILVTTFSSSTYLSRLLLSLENLEGIFEYPDIRTDHPSLRKRLIDTFNRSADPLNTMREFKVIEELKSGMLFLKGLIDVYGLLRGLSMLAMDIIRATVHHLQIGKGFAVIGLGGFGAGELNFSSDLDLLFLSSQQISSPKKALDPAKELIRYLSEYTAKGFAYKVDMRLRPDGSKGVLVNNIEGYRKYYEKHAQVWEIQSLLRARAIAGDIDLIRGFYALRRHILLQRCDEAIGPAMSDMRKRVIREVSRESSGYDVKNGPGGINEIEFLVQYLQMRHMKRHPALIVHNTVTATMRLMKCGMLDAQTGEFLSQAHRFLRTVDTLLRLNEEDVLRINSEITDIICGFLNLSPESELFRKIDGVRIEVSRITEQYYR